MPQRRGVRFPLAASSLPLSGYAAQPLRIVVVITAAAATGLPAQQRDYSGNHPVRYPDPDIVVLDIPQAENAIKGKMLDLAQCSPVERFDSKISGPGDLVGNKVATVAHTTSAAFLKERGIKATEMDSVDGALRAIREGYDAVVFDAPVLQYYVAHAGKGIAQMSGPIFAAEDYGFAFKEGSDLRRQVDAALLSMREDGTYERIRQLWFGAEGSGGSEGGN